MSGITCAPVISAYAASVKACFGELGEPGLTAEASSMASRRRSA